MTPSFDFLRNFMSISIGKSNSYILYLIFTSYMCMRDFNSPMVIDSNFLRKSYKMVSSIKPDGMDYF